MVLPSVNLVCALGRNRVIGVNNRLPWHLPADLAHFKAVTLGHPIIMGRKTYDSIGRPLPGRTNIVVTNQPQWYAPGLVTAHSLNEAITKAAEVTQHNNTDQVMLIGGASLYALALPLIDKLFLTWVDVEPDGDAYFPEVNWADWTIAERSTRMADAANPYNLEFVTYQRRKN